MWNEKVFVKDGVGRTLLNGATEKARSQIREV